MRWGSFRQFQAVSDIVASRITLLIWIHKPHIQLGAVVVQAVTASAGDALVFGHSIRTTAGLAGVRAVTGVCPQFDVLWPEVSAEWMLGVWQGQGSSGRGQVEGRGRAGGRQGEGGRGGKAGDAGTLLHSRF